MSLSDKIKTFFKDFRDNEKTFRQSNEGKVVYGSILSGVTFFGLNFIANQFKKDKNA